MVEVADVSLIFTVKNEIDSIKLLLASIEKQIVLPAEIVVVDGGSDDGTLSEIYDFARRNEALRVKVIVDDVFDPECKGVIARGRNIAIKNAKYDNVLCTDGGCTLGEAWVAKMSAPLLVFQSEVVAGFCQSRSRNSFQKKYEVAMMPDLKSFLSDGALLSSRNIGFKKAAWQKVGGYPEKSYTAEDTLFYIRLLEQGFEIAKIPTAIVYWDCPSDYGELWRKHKRYGYGEGVLQLRPCLFLVRLLLIFMPLHFLRNPKKLKLFSYSYISLVSHQIGYLSGLLFQLRKHG